MQQVDTAKLSIGVSACLLGHAVRYDGGHRSDEWLISVLSKQAELVPICPEMAIGMGVPRPPVELTGDVTDPQATGVDNPSIDVTKPLQRFAQQTAAVSTDLAGFVFKGKSPSCGLNTRLNGVFQPQPVKGIFSQVMSQRFPLMPLVEIEQLNSLQQARERFILAATIYADWQQRVMQGLDMSIIAGFHEYYRLDLLQYTETGCQRLDQWLTEALSDMPADAVEGFAHRYIRGLMALLY